MLAWSTSVRQQAVHDVLASQRSLDPTPALGRIAAPTIVLHGELDRARSVAEAPELAAGIPGARLRLVTAGHTPVHEAPDEAAAAVRDLLRSLPAGR
jgi:pimeloyl-ACP methyl ester carboxylesterase